MDRVQYEQGRASAVEVKHQHESSQFHGSLPEYFAMAENRPLHTVNDWFIRGYWDAVAETLSRTERDFKVNDIVDVIDLRDNAVVARGARIQKLETVTLPGLEEPRLMVDLDCGFGASSACLRHSTAG